MYANRIRNWQPVRRPAKPRPMPKPVAKLPAGFVVAPQFLLGQPAAWQVQLYQAAYQQARAAAEVPQHYRRLFSPN
jgi:hypothetical protein